MGNCFPRRALLWLAMTLGVMPWHAGAARAAEDAPRIVDVQRIWDQAPHNAFTDLVYFRDAWFCVFREGAAHVSPDGAMRVITSTDGRQWRSAARITSADSDLRDAKITITPDDRLMLCGAEALHDRSLKSHQSLAWFSEDGFAWSEAQEIGDPDVWLWRVTWHDSVAYGVGYGVGNDRFTRLYRSPDGIHFETIVPRLNVDGYPNETSLVFADDRALCLLRRDGQSGSALLGQSSPPYTDWQWQDLGVRIGGPQMIQLADGRLVAAVRLLDGQTRTSLCWVDADAGTLTEFLKLPSGGDTSYAGMVERDGLLWISYYSSHEEKTAIYLARVEIPRQGD